jgi:phage/plasmid-like protein (TIGR03299 family)
MSKGNITGMFTVGEKAWWDITGEHNHDREPASIAEAREWCDQAWEYETAPGFERVAIDDPATFEFFADDEVITGEHGPVAVFRPLPKEQRILRNDTRRHLRTEPNSFEIVRVQEMWEVVEAVAQREGKVHLRTGGTFDYGVQLWALAELDEPWQAPGDPSLTYPYVVFLNSIDRNGACKCVNTNVRVVCANTFGAADAQGRATGREFSFRHTRGVHDRIEQAKAAMQGLRADTQAFQQLAAELAAIPVNDRQRELFVVEFIPKPPETIISKRVAHNVEEARSAVRGIFASKTSDGIRGTALELVYGAGEYLDHVRGYRSTATLLRRQLLQPEPFKAQAIKLARRVAAADVTARELEEVSA